MPAPSLPRSHALVSGLAVFGAAFVIYLTTLGSTLVNTDVVVNDFAAWHLAESGSPFFDDVEVIDQGGGPDYFSTNPDGHVVVSRTPGQIWAATPFYLAMRPFTGGEFSNGPGSIAAAFWTALAVLMLFLTLRAYLSLRTSLAFTAVVGLATPLWSVSAESLFPHCITVLGIACAAYAFSRDRLGWAGFFLGLSIVARPHMAIVAAVVGLGLALSGRSIKPAIRIGLPSGLMLAVLLLWNRYVFGGWSITSGYSQGMGDLVPGARDSRMELGYAGQLLGFLVSPDKGLLIWTPIVLILLPTVLRNRAKLPVWTLWLALGGVAYALAQVAVNEFTGGDGFNGYRLGLELLVCLVPCLALAAVHSGTLTRRLALCAVVYQSAMTAVAAYVDNRVSEADVWTDNSTLLAIREEPVAALVLLSLFGLASSWIVLRMSRDSAGARAMQSDPA